MVYANIHVLRAETTKSHKKLTLNRSNSILRGGHFFQKIFARIDASNAQLLTPCLLHQSFSREFPEILPTEFCGDSRLAIHCTFCIQCRR